MKSELFFGINASYNLTTNNLLKEKAALHFWDRGKQKYVYMFPIGVLKEIEALIGIIEIPLLREKFDEKKVFVPQFKGIDNVEIITYPTYYKVIEHRKGKPLEWKTPKTHVDRVWNVVGRQPLNKKIKTRTVAEKICKELGITRFNREGSHTFSFEKFAGSRVSYYRIFYLPMKCLMDQKKIIHHRYGAIERIK